MFCFVLFFCCFARYFYARSRFDVIGNGCCIVCDICFICVCVCLCYFFGVCLYVNMRFFGCFVVFVCDEIVLLCDDVMVLLIVFCGFDDVVDDVVLLMM